MMKNNLFSNMPIDLSEEVFETLVQTHHCKIKRIVSLGHVTPNDDCHEQAEDEFVVLLQGAARLFYLDSKKTIELGVGDYVLIPRGVKHRVEWCDPATPTVWLAMYIT